MGLNLLAKSKVPIAHLFQLVNGHADIGASTDVFTPQATMDERANARAKVILACYHLVIFLEDLANHLFLIFSQTKMISESKKYTLTQMEYHHFMTSHLHHYESEL